MNLSTTPEKSPAADSGVFKIGGDLPVHRLGFGAMRITGAGIWGDPRDPAAARQLLRKVIDLGINLIDTADSYGPEVSERLIAEALHPYPKDLVIATKGGLTRSGPEQWAPVGRPEYLRQCVELSLRRLKLDCIGLYQLHRIDPKVPVAESLGALKELQKKGGRGVRAKNSWRSGENIRAYNRAARVGDERSLRSGHVAQPRRCVSRPRSRRRCRGVAAAIAATAAVCR